MEEEKITVVYKRVNEVQKGAIFEKFERERAVVQGIEKEVKRLEKELGEKTRELEARRKVLELLLEDMKNG